MGLFDDFVELLAIRMFAGCHVGEEIEFVVSSHDDKTRESLIRFFGFGVGRHRKIIAASKYDIAGGVFDPGDHGVCYSVFDHFAGSVEIGGGEGSDFGPRAREMFKRALSAAELGMSSDSGLDYRVVVLREGDF